MDHCFCVAVVVVALRLHVCGAGCARSSALLCLGAPMWAPTVRVDSAWALYSESWLVCGSVVVVVVALFVEFGRAALHVHVSSCMVACCDAIGQSVACPAKCSQSVSNPLLGSSGGPVRVTLVSRRV